MVRSGRLVATTAFAGFALAGCSRGRQLSPIRLEQFLVLGATSGPATMLDWPRVSAHHPLGFRILVPQPGAGSGVPQVYDDNNRYLGALGAEGDGPGEMHDPVFARIGPGDSIYIFAENPRVLVFDPQRALHRSITLPAPVWDGAVLSDGRIAVTSAAHDRPLPFFVLDSRGVVRATLGGGDSTSRGIRSPRWLAVDRDGSYWTMPLQYHWRLEHWDSGGRLIAALEEEPDWFPPYGEQATATAATPPPSTVQGFWLDRDDRLWVLGRVADRTWRKGLTVSSPDSSAGGTVIADPDRAYDTILEVRDPVTGAVLASTRFGDYFPAYTEPGVLMRILETAQGWKQAALMQVVVDSVLPTLPVRR